MKINFNKKSDTIISVKSLVILFYLLSFQLIFANMLLKSPTFENINIDSPIPDSLFFAERNIIPNSFILKGIIKTDSLVSENYVSVFLELNEDYTLEYDSTNYRYILFIRNASSYNYIEIEYAGFPEQYFTEYKL